MQIFPIFWSLARWMLATGERFLTFPKQYLKMKAFMEKYSFKKQKTKKSLTWIQTRLEQSAEEEPSFFKR